MSTSHYRGSVHMRRAWKDEARRSGGMRKDMHEQARQWRRRSHHPDWEEPEQEQEQAMDPAVLVYRRAEKLAAQKVDLFRDVLVAAVIIIPLMYISRPLGVIFLFIFGISLVKRIYNVMIEPDLRKKFVEEELRKIVNDRVNQQSRTMKDKHTRSMEELSASIAHEIRNPITAAKSLVQQMGEEPSASENTEYARVALEELERVDRSISHLLRFARDEELIMKEVRLAELLDSVLESFRDRVARSNIEITCKIDSPGEVRADGEKIRRVVINLLTNAIDALEASRAESPRIEVSMGENLAGNEIWLLIKDNGPGIDSKVHAKIFSPFYTSKAKGTGLGLAITKKIVEAHGGEIELVGTPDQGAEFLLTLPKDPALKSSTATGGQK